MAELRNVSPVPGAYVSESNFFEKDWQHSFWGANYQRLQKVKAKYDPDGLFFVHHGVGSEEWSADGFIRLTQLSHRCSCDSSKAAENCGVPKPPLICGAKESLPFSWVFGLTGSTTVWWHSWPRKAFRSAGRQKSRLCRDFRSVTSPNSPTSPGRCGA